MVTPEPCPTCGQSDATPRRTVPSSAGYRCPDCKRFKIRDTTPEPCVVCGGRGETLTEDCYGDCGAECMVTCRVCMGSRVRPSPWGWTASLGPENSSEVGTGAKDSTGGRKSMANVHDDYDEGMYHQGDDDVAIPMPHRETHRMARAEALEAAVTAERERVLSVIDGFMSGPTREDAWLRNLMRRLRSGEL